MGQIRNRRRGERNHGVWKNLPTAEKINQSEAKRAFDSSTEVNRHLFLSFIASNVYIILTIGSTTDYQLLIGGIAILPFVNIQLPLEIFYFVIPLILLSIHFNLLINLSKHSRKVFASQKIYNVPEADILVEPFLFNFLLYTVRPRINSYLLPIIGFFCVYCLTPITLILMQVVLSKLHSLFLTGWHNLIVILDLVLLSVYWRRLVHPRFMSEKYLSWRYIPFIKITKKLTKFIKLIAVHPLRFVKTWYKLKHFIKTTFASPKIQMKKIATFIFIIGVTISLADSFILFTMKTGKGIQFFLNIEQEYFHHIEEMEEYRTDMTEKNLGLTNVEQKKIIEPKLSIETYLLWHLLRFVTLDLSELSLYTGRIKNLIIEQPYRQVTEPKAAEENFYHVKSITLRDRDLRFANFNSAKMNKIDLRNSALDGAMFYFTQLNSADLKYCSLKGAYLKNSNLEKADLRKAILTGANLDNAKLIRAKITKTQFAKASMIEADLSYTEGEKAGFAESDLTFADLSGAYLNGANFTNATLKDAKLNDTSLVGAKFYMANMSHTQLILADMSESSLHGADLEYAQMLGAILIRAKMHACSLESADLSGADLTAAELYAVFGERANFMASNLDGAKMQLGNFKFANLRGAYLKGAKVGDANFEKVTFSDCYGKVDHNRLNLDWSKLWHEKISGQLYRWKETFQRRFETAKKAATASYDKIEPEVNFCLNRFEDFLAARNVIVCEEGFSIGKGILTQYRTSAIAAVERERQEETLPGIKDIDFLKEYIKSTCPKNITIIDTELQK